MPATDERSEQIVAEGEARRREERRQEVAAAQRTLETGEWIDLQRQVAFWRASYVAATKALSDVIGGDEAGAAVRLVDEIIAIRWGDWYTCPRCGKRVGEQGVELDG